MISKEPKEILGNQVISDYSNQIRLDGAYAGIKILSERIGEIGSSLNKDSILQASKTMTESLFPVTSNVGIISSIEGLKQVTSQLPIHNELALDKEVLFRITDQIQKKHSGGLYLFRHGRGYYQFDGEKSGNII